MNRNIFIMAVGLAMLIFLTPALAADVYVASGGANVRAGGGMEHPVITHAAGGVRLELLEEQGNWSRVRLPGGAEGWIYSPLLSASPAPTVPKDAGKEAKRYLEAGNNYFHKGSYDEAVAEYRKALALDPDNADARYDIANSYHRKGLSGEAVEQYLKALEVKPNHLPARNNLALIYFEQGNYSKAVEQWEKGLQYDAGYMEINYNLAQGYEKVDMEKAVKQWNRYLELARGKPEEAEFVSKVRDRLDRLLGE